MQEQTITKFGELTLKNKQKYKYDLRKIMHEDEYSIKRLFKNTNAVRANFQVFEAEREKALQKLRSLTSELQTKRLRINAHDFCDYFTL